MRWWRMMVVLILSAVAACDDDDPVSVDIGAVEAEVATSGEDLDSDGYTIQLDGGAVSEAIDINDTFTFEDVDAGDHEVELTGIASNCAVDGDNPQTVTVEADATATATFSVVCSASS